MKRIFFITAVLAAMASATMSCGYFGGKKNAAETELDDSTKTAMEMERMRKEEPEFIIETTHGTMKVKLYSKTPQHRDNFAKLVSEKYYDGIRFHASKGNPLVQHLYDSMGFCRAGEITFPYGDFICYEMKL